MNALNLNTMKWKAVNFIMNHKKAAFAIAAIIDTALVCALIYCIFG
jgi:hypothetical protein